MKNNVDIKICAICIKKINNADDYFRITQFIKGKEHDTQYAHRNCWINKSKIEQNLGKLVTSLVQKTAELGILPTESQETEV